MRYVTEIQLAISNLYTHKLRTFLTMLGMIFGVGAVIAMLSIGAGAEKESLRIIDTMGLRNVIVKDREFKDEDLKKVRENSIGLSMRDVQAVTAVTPSYFRLARYDLAEGSLLSDTDQKDFEQFCVIGSRVKQKLFGAESPVGKTLKIDKMWFTVVGVLADNNLTKDEFEGVKLQDFSNDIYIPL